MPRWKPPPPMNKSVFASLLLALPLSLSAAPQSLNVPLPPPSPATRRGAGFDRGTGWLCPARSAAAAPAPCRLRRLARVAGRRARAHPPGRCAIQCAARGPAAASATAVRRSDQAFRDGWRLGPQLGLEFPKLHGLFGFVPPEQRETALAVLRQLSPAQLAQLAWSRSVRRRRSATPCAAPSLRCRPPNATAGSSAKRASKKGRRVKSHSALTGQIRLNPLRPLFAWGSRNPAFTPCHGMRAGRVR